MARKKPPFDLKTALHEAKNKRDYEGKRDIHLFWTISNRQIDGDKDGAAAKETLGIGLDHCESVADILVIASAWRCHFMLDAGYSDILRVGEARAAICQDWIAIAEETYDGICSLDEPARSNATDWRGRVASNLERAATLATTAKDKRGVANGFRSYLGNQNRADQIMPSGVLPDELLAMATSTTGYPPEDHPPGAPWWWDTPFEISDGRGIVLTPPADWPEDPVRLLTLLRERVTQAMLESIATADYGMDYDKHLAALEECQRSGRVPVPLPWCPLEVLSLSQWVQGDDTDHMQRAFACTVLLIPCVGPDYQDAPEQTIAIALESCIVLGPAYVHALIGLLVAIGATTRYGDDMLLFVWLAVLIAQAHLDPTDLRLPALATDLETMEARFAAQGYSKPDHGWLLGVTFFDQRHDLWRSLAANALGPAVEAQPMSDALALVATLLKAPNP